MKSRLYFVSSVLIWGAIIIVPVVYFRGALNYYESVKPPEGVETYLQIVEEGVTFESARKVDHAKAYIITFGAPQNWLLRSGPPAYCFDREGKLIDYTRDVGDSTVFQDDYLVFDGAEIPLDAVGNQFKKP